MNYEQSEGCGPPEKITSTLTYLGVYVALLALTLATTLIAFVDLGVWSMVIAVTIAGMKAALVILFFMEALHNHRLNPAFFFFGFVWLLILIALTLGDYMTRGLDSFPRSLRFFLPPRGVLSAAANDTGAVFPHSRRT